MCVRACVRDHADGVFPRPVWAWNGLRYERINCKFPFFFGLCGGFGGRVDSAAFYFGEVEWSSGKHWW